MDTRKGSEDFEKAGQAMLNERYELPPREEIEELVRRARVVTRSDSPDPVQFMAAAAVLLACGACSRSPADPTHGLAVATLAIAARDLKAQLETAATS